jgi:hypothetical protein
MTRLPRSPGSTLVLWLNQETVHDFILLFMPPCGPHLTPLATGSLERSLLVFSTPGASPATTFHACSSPAPTRVKPQPALAILSQESVHTTLSITHHTRKRPSTGPRTTHGPQDQRWRREGSKRGLQAVGLGVLASFIAAIFIDGVLRSIHHPYVL